MVARAAVLGGGEEGGVKHSSRCECEACPAALRGVRMARTLLEARRIAREALGVAG